MITIHRAFNPADAQLVRSRLEAADAQKFLSDSTPLNDQSNPPPG